MKGTKDGIERHALSVIREDLKEKIVLITGPRQCGKTTLSRQLLSYAQYFNWDSSEDRIRIEEKSWDRKLPLIIFDELHKRKNWKSWLKGIYDTEGLPPALLVTGSARLNIHRQLGDSLAGRFFQHRLHPFDLAELQGYLPPADAFGRLMKFGGFPEPFLRGEERFYRRWQKTHLDVILRDDLIDLTALRDVQSVATLVELLRVRVGSLTSTASLARDLACSPQTVSRWLQVLEDLYIIFRVVPHHRNVARALLKEPKFYFWDIAAVKSEAARFENLIASALLKEIDRRVDHDGVDAELRFVRTKEGHEVDFLVIIDDKPLLLIEAKMSDTSMSPHLDRLGHFLPNAKRLQLVHSLKGGDRTWPDGQALRLAAPWLANIRENFDELL